MYSYQQLRHNEVRFSPQECQEYAILVCCQLESNDRPTPWYLMNVIRV